MSPDEINAFENIVNHLQALDGETRERVLAYTAVALKIDPSKTLVVTRSDSDGSSAENSGIQPDKPMQDKSNIRDIRSLKDEKKPSSAVEMAVLVAYYLDELAGPEDRKDSIGIKDLDKYFKQAGYRVPVRMANVTNAARDSGYIDRKAHGQYSLNPVGYNLAVHGLPRSGTKPQVRKSKSRPKSNPKKVEATSKKKTTPKPKK